MNRKLLKDATKKKDRDRELEIIGLKCNYLGFRKNGNEKNHLLYIYNFFSLAFILCRQSGDVNCEVNL